MRLNLSVKPRMIFRRHLAKTELVALATLVGIAASLAVFFAARAAAAPLYAWLRSTGRASWGTAMCVDLVPGLVLLFVALDLGLWAIGCGLVVALVTHAVCRLEA